MIAPGAALSVVGLILDIVGFLILASDILPAARLDRAERLLDDVRAYMQVNGFSVTAPSRRPTDKFDSSYHVLPPEGELTLAAKILGVRVAKVEGGTLPEATEQLLAAALSEKRALDARRPRPPLRVGIALIVFGFAFQAAGTITSGMVL
jgi:hypothetical protein